MSLPALLVAAFLAGLAGGGWLGWEAQGWKRDSAEKERIEMEARAMLRRQENAIDASAKFQATQGEAEAREVEVIKEVVRVVSKPVYRERCLDDDGMRILSADIQAANARRGLGPALPASSASN